MALNEADHKNLERLLHAIEKVYHSPRHLVWRGFMIGLASGLGATLGVAIVVGILGFVLRELGGIPFIGDWFNRVNDTLPRY